MVAGLQAGLQAEDGGGDFLVGGAFHRVQAVLQQRLGGRVALLGAVDGDARVASSVAMSATDWPLPGALSPFVTRCATAS